MKDRTPDRLFAAERSAAQPFAFDEVVAEVFEDMINRSVPGYQTLLGMIGVLANRYIQPDSNVYDLGCSLGASTLMIAQNTAGKRYKLIAIDNSSAMIERCRKNLSVVETPKIELVCSDIQNLRYENASLTIMNLTLQFIPPDARNGLLKSIYTGLRPGGALILCEKTCSESPTEQEFLTDLYLDYKRANGYSELEISQKRNALENVLIPDSSDALAQRLETAGFNEIHAWFRCLNFVAYIAIK